MAKAHPKFNRIAPWADRFNTPSTAQLQSGLPAPVASIFKQARRMLHDAGFTHESPQWRGECWKWTIEFSAGPRRELMAILIPSPENLQFALPVTAEFLQSLPMKRLKKSVREGLELAAEPFDTNLAVWFLTAGLVSDLEDLLQRRVRQLTRKTG
ncbi:MAG: hypothetical protein KDA22_15095 [Phycisphaerales bacterium]|nr:hypothetical protein [Phycisphaerales bacterium]